MVLIWGLNWVFMKIGLLFVNPLSFVAQRFLFASIALLPFLIWERRILPRDGRTWFKLIVLSLTGAASMASSHIGLLHETAGLSSLLTYTQPLFVFCLAAIFLKEKINVTRIIGVTLGFLGIITLYIDRFFFHMSPIDSLIFLILGAFLWAAGVVYYKMFLREVDPVVINIIQSLVGSALLFPIAFTLDGSVFSSDGLYIFSILYSSLLGSALAFTIWLSLIKEEETIIISTSSLIVPVIAALLGWLLIGEQIGYNLLISIVLVLTGLYLVNVG